MKKRFLIIAALIGLLANCPEPFSGSSDDTNDQNQKTFIVFDNKQGICTAIVYDDHRRRDEDKIAEIPAGTVSREIEWTAGTSVPFYFSYRINIKGVSGFTLNYTPREVGRDQTAVRVDAYTKTNITIPRLDETVSSPDMLLVNNSYLLIQNNSSYSFQLYRGSSPISPDGSSNPLVVSGERAQYTVNPGAASNYRLLVGADYVTFPGSLVSFEAGYVYSFVFDGGVSLVSEVEIKLENVAGVSNNPVPNAPSAPVVTASDKLLTLHWTAVEGAENYEVYMGTAQTPPAQPVKTVPGTTTVLTGLTNKTAYYVWIKAVNSTGASGFSPGTRGIPWPANEVPAAPGSLVIIPGINQLTVTWEGSGGASSYEVYYSTTTTTPFSPAATTDKTSAIINGLQNGTIYYIWVRAVNSRGKSGYSPVEAGTPRIPTAAPAAPSGPVLTAGNKELAVSWQAVELAAAYEVWFGTSGNSAQAVKFGGDISNGITETVITGLVNEQTYYVWLKAKNVVGTSGFSLPTYATPSAFAVLPEIPAMPAVIAGNRELSVSWQPVEGALSYEVWTGATNNSAQAVKFGGDITGTSATLTGLNNGTTYYIWIKAKNSIGASGFSPRASGTPSASTVTPSDPQAAPTVTAGNGQLSLSWQAVEGAASYEIWAGTTNDPTAASKRGNDVSSTSATITGLNNGTTYYVWIKAKNSVGTSGFSPMASGTPSVFSVTPQAPSAPAVSIGNGQISVSWTAVEGATAYEIWLGTSNNSSSAAKNGNDEGVSLSRTISGLTNGTAYYIWIKAKNSIGTSGFSPVAIGKPIANNIVTPTLTSGNGQLSASWAAIAGADEYEVFCGTGVNPPQTASQTVNVTTATITGLTNGTIYNVWVRGKNSTVTGTMGSPANARPIGNMGAVTLISGNGQLTVSWSTVAGADQYEVYHSTGNSIPASPSQVVNAPATAATISGLTNGTTYYVWVKPKNANGFGNVSTVKNEKPLGTPGAPTVTTGGGWLQVTWSDVAGADQYEVYYGTDTQPATLATTTAVTTATITGLTGGTTYYIRLRAKNSSGVSDYGPSASGIPSNGPGLYRGGGTQKIGNYNLSTALSYISTNAVSGDDYLIIVGANEAISPVTLSYSGKTVGITLQGDGSERTITLGSNGNMFTVENGVTLTLDEHITLVGRSSNSGSVVHVSTNGTFIMYGGTIRGNTMTSGAGVNVNGSGVCIVGGVFTMYGGTIRGNTAYGNNLNGGGVAVRASGIFTMYGGTIRENASTNDFGPAYGGGVLVAGTFTMHGGTISGNTSSNTGSYVSFGGGVYVTYGTFTMHGGTINGNTATSGTDSAGYGGGVYVDSSNGIFIKLPYGSGQDSGIIYGSEAVGNDANGIPLRNTARAGSDAVNGRNTTVGQTDHIGQ